MEAMASGLPMIVSGVFGAEHFLGNGGLILRDPNDVSGLSELIIRILSKDEERRAMGQAGRQRAIEMQWSMMAARYLDVYDKFLIESSA
jgi:glycosyltransferase involved in cell wall biosynthesis